MIVTHAAFVSGFVEGTALTGSFADVLALTDDIDVIIVLNSCDQPIYLQVPNRSSTTDIYLPAMGSFALDGRTNASRIAKGTFKAKHAGAAPTGGQLSVTGIG